MATASEVTATGAWQILAPDDARWLGLVEEHPGALPFHRPAWLAVLAESYRFEAFVLAVPGADGELAAGLPLMAVRDPIRGLRWIALPFTDRCPPLLATPDAAAAFAAALDAARLAAGVERVEIRAPVASEGLASGVVAVWHELDLTAGQEAVERSFTSATRRNTKKARREHLELRVADAETDLTRVFFRLHAQTRRRLGSPVQPRRFFKSLWRYGIDRGLGQVFIVLQRGRPVAAAVFLTDAPTVVYKYGASDERAWSARPNNLLFAEAIERACARGAASFDFGRSDLDNHGLRAFKAGWGPEELPLTYSSTGGFAPAPQFGSLPARLAASAVRRSPTWVSRGVGAMLYRYAA